MSPSLRWILMGVFAVLTVGLLGYTVQTSRAKIQMLESEVSFYQSQATSLQAQAESFYFVVTNQETVTRVNELASEADKAMRETMAEAILENWTGLLVRFPQGGDVRDAIDAVAQADALPERQRLAGEYVTLTRKMAGLEDVIDGSIDEQLEVEEEDARTVSTLVTAAGGILSALMTLVVFFQGGDRRVLEDEMLALEVEKMRIEVDRMRRSNEATPGGHTG